jgi:hypothetical protein
LTFNYLELILSSGVGRLDDVCSPSALMRGRPKFKSCGGTAYFPAAAKTLKHPSPETIQFYYHDTKDHPYVGEQKAVLEKDDAGLVSKIVWSPPYPGTDRSYRIRWDWSVAPKHD